MIAKAIDKILSIAKPPVVDVYGEKYATEKMYRLDATLRAEPVNVSTLSSIVTYIKEFKEAWSDDPLLVHVASPTRVELTTALDEDRKRELLMVAEAELPSIPFERYIDNERMLITIQSMFVNDVETDTAAVLKFAGTVTSGSIKEYGDDGITQQATIRQGVASKANAIVPSPCVLRPYRTFMEVEQPASSFVFRMRESGRDGVESALFEADGGMWKLEAVANISNYLKDALEGTGVTVIS